MARCRVLGRLDYVIGDGLDDQERAWLRLMFDYHVRHGRPLGPLSLRALLGWASLREDA